MRNRLRAEELLEVFRNIDVEDFTADNLGINTIISCFGYGVIDGDPRANGESQLIWQTIYYPLLIKRIIEAINRKGETWVSIGSEYVKTPKLPKCSQLTLEYAQVFPILNNIDGAEEEVIRYIIKKLWRL